MTDKERWENFEHRKLIEEAIHMTKEEDFPFLLFCVEGSPWEGYTKTHIADVNRTKFFFVNVPRFV